MDLPKFVTVLIFIIGSKNLNDAIKESHCISLVDNGKEETNEYFHNKYLFVCLNMGICVGCFK